MSLASRYGQSQSEVKQPSFWRFNGLLAIAAALPVAAVGLTNWWVDPYSVYATPVVAGWNQAKTGTEKNDRLFKAAEVIRQRPPAILLGSSRIKQGMDPDTALLPEGTYNLGLNGVTVYELEQYLDHAIANSPDLKQVVFGIDFFMFDANRPPEATFSAQRLGQRRLPVGDLLATTLSLGTLGESWATVQQSRDLSREARADNGFAPNTRAEDGKTEWRFEQAVTDYYRHHADYELSTEQLERFRAMLERCKAQGIEVVVFISPAHAVQWETIRATGRWEVFEQWQREIARITPVWDFSGYNRVTTEPVGEVMENYTDSSHYRPEIGDRVLRQILTGSQSAENFGTLLTPATVEAKIKTTREQRAAWAAQNSDLVAQVEAAYADFVAKQ